MWQGPPDENWTPGPAVVRGSPSNASSAPLLSRASPRGHAADHGETADWAGAGGRSPSSSAPAAPASSPLAAMFSSWMGSLTGGGDQDLDHEDHHLHHPHTGSSPASSSRSRTRLGGATRHEYRTVPPDNIRSLDGEDGGRVGNNAESASHLFYRPEDKPERVHIPPGSQPMGQQVIDTEVWVIGNEVCIGPLAAPGPWDYCLKRERRRQMTRVGYGRGDYVFDMEYRSGPGGIGQWDMSYRYVGPCQGQFVLREAGEEEDLLLKLTPHKRRIYLAGLLFIFAFAAIVVGLTSASKAAVFSAPTTTTTTMYFAPFTTTHHQGTTLLDLPALPHSTTHMTIAGYAALVASTYENSEAAWRDLSNHEDYAQTVDFNAVRHFTKLHLRPPLSDAEAWLFFSEMDGNHDLVVSRDEFFSGMRGQVLRPITTTQRLTTTTTRPPTPPPTTSTTVIFPIATPAPLLSTTAPATTTAPPPPPPPPPAAPSTGKAKPSNPLDINLKTFADRLDEYYGSPQRGQRELYSRSPSKVDFPTFSVFAGQLWPPLNQTQAWLVFTYLDTNKDLSVQDSEFSSVMSSAEQEEEHEEQL